MRAVNRSSWPVWVGVLASLAGLAIWQRATQVTFADTSFTSGYFLLGLMVFLAIYSGRKRLWMFPVGRASIWLTLHLGVGVVAMAFFFVHARTPWPLGVTERALTVLFYGVFGSGIVGYGLQLWLPARLVHAGPELIYERIPGEIASIRAQVEKEVLKAIEDSGNDTLGLDYLQILAWYFAKPRYFWSSAFGGRRAEHIMNRHFNTVGRYLTDIERSHWAKIAELVAAKRRADVQYAMQTLLKRWTIFHVPLAAALLTLSIWHIVLVHVFAR